jgi:hypothetical protein
MIQAAVTSLPTGKLFLMRADGHYQEFLSRLRDVCAGLELTPVEAVDMVRRELGEDIGDNFEAWLEEERG